ncbi:MAG: LysR family transcriptional regulator [Wenzhouxiangella sp.]
MHQFKILRVVAEEGSIAAAARRLHLTPSTLSIQLAQLAEALGFPLHEISGRQLRLTGAGRDALESARRIDDELRLLAQRMAARRGIERGRLSIAAVSTAEYVLPDLIGRFQKAHPGIEARLSIVSRKNLLKRLAEGLDDAYLMTRTPVRDDLEVETVGLNPLVMIAAPDHPGLATPDLTLEALKGEAFVVREKASGTRWWTLRWLEHFGARLRPALELGSNEAIKQAVMGGHGLAVISLHAVLPELAAGRLALLRLPHFPIPVDWRLVRRRGRPETPAAAAFRAHLHEQMPALDRRIVETLSAYELTLECPTTDFAALLHDETPSRSVLP